jgi:ABC-type branched-subunit amino acid transport system ATPase component
VLLEVVDVHKSFGGVSAVAGTSFGVVDGSITALIGPNGAGKTTVFNLISGFLRADRGAVLFAGERIEKRRSDAVARAGLVRAFQSARVLSRMTVIENIMLAGKNQPGEQFGAAWRTCAPVAA